MITRIREVRKARGLTLEQVGALCDPPTTAQTIGRLETGTRTVSVKWLNRIAQALAVTSAKRSAILPDVPTIAESGVAGYEVYEWNVLLAPAGTPAERVARLHAATAAALARPETQRQITSQGARVVASRPEDAATIRRLEGWSEGDPIPESYGASFLTNPNRVTCRHCEKEYETADSGDQEVPEGESPFG